MEPQKQPPQLHYHIHWSRVVALDWEVFASRAEAEASAKQFMRRDETYVIEERDETCPRCRFAMDLKMDHDAPGEAPTLKYPWQQVVLDAFTETRSEFLPLKINMAERAISARLCKSVDLEEQIKIREALQSLRALVPEPKKDSNQKHDSGEKTANA